MESSFIQGVWVHRHVFSQFLGREITHVTSCLLLQTILTYQNDFFSQSKIFFPLRVDHREAGRQNLGWQSCFHTELLIREYLVIIRDNFLHKSICCDPHLNRLFETVQMRGHNIWF